MKPGFEAAIFLCILCALLWIPSPSFAATRYVNVNSTNSVAPYTGWSTAARTLQDAADISADGDLVLVTNGYYQAGGVANFPFGSLLTNRLAITNAITVQSVNGPFVTFIVGSNTLDNAAIRGVFMASGSALIGFTVSHCSTRKVGYNYDDRSGGGIWCSDSSCVISNCIIADNDAQDDAAGVLWGTLYNCTLLRNDCGENGGGVREGILYACTLRDNFAFRGGGVYYSTLYNCTVASNIAFRGGGAEGGDFFHCTIVTNWAMQNAGGVFEGQMVNCIVYHNDCASNANWEGGTISYTCTDPLPAGNGNITNEPGLVSVPAGNFRLMSNSPCVDAGTNGVAFVDKDGVPRPLDGNLDGINIADMGAYELVHDAGDSDGDGMLDGWEIDYRLDPLNPADAALDPDTDGPVSHDEFIAGTDPNNSNSYFRLTRVRQSATNELVTWSSATGRVYVLERMTGMTGNTWSVTASGLAARPPENTYTDAVSEVQSYYRVWVNRTNAYYPP